MLRPATTKEMQKAVERRVLDSVACVRGTPLDRTDHRDSDSFPDGFFIERDGSKTPAEVVAAFEREADERPREGSRWRRAWNQAEQMARKIEEEHGVPAAWGAHGSEPFAIPLDGSTLLRPRLEPMHPERWIVAALERKLTKYGPALDVVLVVHLHSPFDLERRQLAALGEWLKSTGRPFREVWVVNEYGTPPQRVPG